LRIQRLTVSTACILVRLAVTLNRESTKRAKRGPNSWRRATKRSGGRPGAAVFEEARPAKRHPALREMAAGTDERRPESGELQVEARRWSGPWR
jgi:hypothetical protein